MPKTILQYLNIAGFLWTLCISMFHISIPRWLLYGGIYLFVATWVIEIFVEKRWQQVKPDAQWIHYGALILLFCLGFIYAPWDGDVYFHHHAEQRIPLIAFGLIGIFRDLCGAGAERYSQCLFGAIPFLHNRLAGSALFP